MQEEQMTFRWHNLKKYLYKQVCPVKLRSGTFSTVRAGWLVRKRKHCRVEMENEPIFFPCRNHTNNRSAGGGGRLDFTHLCS